jgi:hypothetical protein
MPKITSAGSFVLEGTAVTVPDRAVTDSAIIFVMLQDTKANGSGGWDGHHGIVNREPGRSFNFSAPRPGNGARFGFIVVEP